MIASTVINKGAALYTFDKHFLSLEDLGLSNWANTGNRDNLTKDWFESNVTYIYINLLDHWIAHA